MQELLRANSSPLDSSSLVIGVPNTNKVELCSWWNGNQPAAEAARLRAASATCVYPARSGGSFLLTGSVWEVEFASSCTTRADLKEKLELFTESSFQVVTRVWRSRFLLMEQALLWEELLSHLCLLLLDRNDSSKKLWFSVISKCGLSVGFPTQRPFSVEVVGFESSVQI